jgi:hypothetical protein
MFMSKEAIERMLTDHKNAYYHRWQKEISAIEEAAGRYIYQPEWKREADKAAFYQEMLEEIAYKTHGQYVNKLKRERIVRQMEDLTYNTPPPWDEIVVFPRIETIFMSNLYEESALFSVSGFLSTKQRKQYEKMSVHPARAS